MSNEVFNEGPTTSQHVESNDKDYINKTTFKLKRTRSVGVLDGYVADARALKDARSNPVVPTSAGNSSTTHHAASGTQKKITSRDFVSDATLQRLNIVPQQSSPYTEEELSHVPSFYRRVVAGSSGAISSGATSSGGREGTSTATPATPSTSPSPATSITPKHQLKQQKLKQRQAERIRRHRVDLVTSHALHDDTDVEVRPKQHVDYLSHRWGAADEVLKCWRYVVLRRHDFADGARLENASWRTWAQTRNHLKTISPEELNWSKDNDVTWLYGPAFQSEIEGDADDEDEAMSEDDNDDEEAVERRAASDGEEPQRPFTHRRASSFNTSDHLKSILKKKTNVETLIGDGSYNRLQTFLDKRDHRFVGSPILESTSSHALSVSPYQNGVATQDNPSPLSLEGTVAVPTTAPIPPSHLSREITPVVQPVPPVPQQPTQPAALSSSKSSLRDPIAALASRPERHIHFNMRVDQCIALPDSPPEFRDSSSMSSGVLSDGGSEIHTDNEEDVSRSSSSGSYSSTGSSDSPDVRLGSSFTFNEESEQTFNEFYSGGSSMEDEDDDQEPPLRPHRHHRRRHHTRPHTHAHRSIAPLPATMLKFSSDDDSAERTLYTVSHNTRTNRGYEYHYDYNQVAVDSALEMVDIPADLGIRSDDAPDGPEIATTIEPPLLEVTEAPHAGGGNARPHGTFVFDSDSDSSSSYSSDDDYGSGSGSGSVSGSISGSLIGSAPASIGGGSAAPSLTASPSGSLLLLRSPLLSDSAAPHVPSHLSTTLVDSDMDTDSSQSSSSDSDDGLVLSAVPRSRSFLGVPPATGHTSSVASTTPTTAVSTPLGHSRASYSSVASLTHALQDHRGH